MTQVMADIRGIEHELSTLSAAKTVGPRVALPRLLPSSRTPARPASPSGPAATASATAAEAATEAADATPGLADVRKNLLSSYFSTDEGAAVAVPTNPMLEAAVAKVGGTAPPGAASRTPQRGGGGERRAGVAELDDSGEALLLRSPGDALLLELEAAGVAGGGDSGGGHWQGSPAPLGGPLGAPPHSEVDLVRSLA